MVRLSCFAPPINCHRPKKVIQHSAEVMRSNPRENPQEQADPSLSSDNSLFDTSVEQHPSSTSCECYWEENLRNKSCTDESEEICAMMRLKESPYLGSGLDKGRHFPADDVTGDDNIDQGFSSDYSKDNAMKTVGESSYSTDSAEVDGNKDSSENTHKEYHENEVVESLILVDSPLHHELLSSARIRQVVREHNDDVNGSMHSSDTFSILPKSCSLTNFLLDTANCIGDACVHDSAGHRSKSVQDLDSRHGGRDESLNGEDALSSDVTFQEHIAASEFHDTPESSDLHGKDSPCNADSGEECLFTSSIDGFNEAADTERNSIYSRGKLKCDSQSVEAHKPDIHDDLVNVKEPETGGVQLKEKLQQDYIQKWDGLASKEFTIERIEQWIRHIDMNNTIVEEQGECSHSVPVKELPLVAVEIDAKNIGMKLASNYTSSLTTASSSAKLSNLRLTVVPFLGGFKNLRVLNLSGNNIVRITSGVLPGGLHMLNLSKNELSTIDGLRDLTRLRILNLSYNRIIRIGHGLASCSSLKELYLAGNKISEVEGLHRLLKLSCIDLSLNRVSSIGGLSQLAANYGSLKAIDLEGNPAQRNVGDEHIKKHLLSLLPHLSYYNKQAIRAVCSIGIASNQSDRRNRSSGL